MKDWQFKALTFEKQRYEAISKIMLCLDFKGHIGDVYFDNIQLSPITVDRVGAGYFEDEFSETEEESGGAGEEVVAKKDKYGNDLGTVSSAGSVCLYASNDYTNEGNDLYAQSDERLNKTLFETNKATSNVITEYPPDRSPITYEFYPNKPDLLKSVSAQVGLQVLKTDYEYDYMGNVIKISSGNNAYSVSYDALNQLKSIGLDNKNSLVNYTYTNNTGKIKTVSYANGSVVAYTYDRFGRIVKEIWSNANNVKEGEYEYGYDSENNLVRSIDKNRKVLYNYRYHNGQLVEATESKFEEVTSNGLTYIVKENAAATDSVTTYDVDEYRMNLPFDKAYISHGVDSLGRKDLTEIRLNNKLITQRYEYVKGAMDAKCFNKRDGEPTTNLVSKIEYSDGSSLQYEYDKAGNITQVYTDGVLTQRYEYDGIGRLIRDDNSETDLTTLYAYDAGGNIKEKKEYICSFDTPRGEPAVKTYTYDSVWADCLKTYTGYEGEMLCARIIMNGQNQPEFIYTGNPNKYNGYTMTWDKGRQLKSMSKTGSNLSFEYNANGIRTKKTANNIVHNYYMQGANIMLETIKNGGTINALQYLYDDNDEIAGIGYNGTPYYFVKNLQGDVIKLLDSNAECLVKYIYNSWGKVIKVTDSNGTQILDDTHIAHVNPIRYRSYYYDAETCLYYLQSRYYDPETCRFINADDAKTISFMTEDGLCCNLFVYLNNAPNLGSDPTGYAKLRFVGCGIQVLVSLGVIEFGIEFVWYPNKSVEIKGGNRDVPIVYLFGDISINKDMAQSLINSFKKKPSLLSKASKGKLNKISFSVGFFAIFGYANFTSYKNYLGSFQTVSATFWHVKLYTSWSDKCIVVGVAFDTSFAGASYSTSYYILLSTAADFLSGLFKNVQKKTKHLKP